VLLIASSPRVSFSSFSSSLSFTVTLILAAVVALRGLLLLARQEVRLRAQAVRVDPELDVDV